MRLLLQLRILLGLLSEHILLNKRDPWTYH